ncbi:hypothetical protein BGZ65_012797 [Modicella reniformis]|uniref:NFACT RNA-binding domain-containing protein n=1 Tax=Modicella reniformis TaxID=1440133 RepID=A0A9P6LNX6_9FUNG|nr:hypothetical protein BGZ65_012797 [Modicella reniformis]
MIFMGKDKNENEDLIKHGFEEDVWFHVDNYSSAHVYLRLSPDQTWDSIPETLLDDMAQLTKANSIEGNKRKNLTVIYTPWSNLKKSGDMAVGQVSFKKQKMVKRVFIADRINDTINRLNRTKVENFPDLAQEKIDHERTLRKQQKQEEHTRHQMEYEKVQQLKQQASERSYASIFEDADMAGSSNYRNMDGDPADLEEDFM